MRGTGSTVLQTPITPNCFRVHVRRRTHSGTIEGLIGSFTSGRRVPASAVPVAGRRFYALQQMRSVGPVIIITDGKRNAKFASPTYNHLLAGTNPSCQRLEVNASERLLQDQCIICRRESSCVLVGHTRIPRFNGECVAAS